MNNGVSHGIRLTKNSKFTIRSELMQQTIETSEASKPGEETPSLDAIIL